jgi:hypothetical protein
MELWEFIDDDGTIARTDNHAVAMTICLSGDPRGKINQNIIAVAKFRMNKRNSYIR